MRTLIILSCLFTFNAQASVQLPTPEYVDINEYVGKWYAITSMPQFFTRNCVGQIAEYEVINSTTISVLNTCIKKNGSQKSISGKAVVANPRTNAELTVTFNNFWTKLFRVKGDYTIIKLDDSYSSVLVGSKNRKSLWILARTPYLSEEIRKEYLDYAKSLNFDTSNLIESKF